MRARELRYGDVLRSVAQHGHVVMYLGGGDNFGIGRRNLLILAGARMLILEHVEDGDIVEVPPQVLGHYELVESGPELPGTA